MQNYDDDDDDDDRTFVYFPLEPKVQRNARRFRIRNGFLMFLICSMPVVVLGYFTIVK